MTKEKLFRLAQKYLNKTATEEEKKLLHQWYDSVDAEEIEIVFTEKPESGEDIQKRILSRLQKTISEEKNSNDTIKYMPAKKKIKPVWWLAAAVILVLFSAGDYLWLHSRETKTEIKKEDVAQRYKNDVPPGKQKAELVLADGSVIDLDDANNGVIKKQGNTQIKKQNGQLLYHALSAVRPAVILFNTVITPRGGQYQVVLPDGTKVWLNAASSLKFPTAFTGNERKVTLTGEAYFEVKPLSPKGEQKTSLEEKNRVPFIVHVNSPLASGEGGISIKVLGTHFNVMAYDDESAITTTLLEGSVKISEQNSTALLLPGQQATLDKNKNNITVNDADTEAAVAWKNGLFEFNNDNIEIIMRELSRWYNVEVSYQGDEVKNKNFTGLISRNTNISEVLKMLELTGVLQFKVTGREVTVLPD